MDGSNEDNPAISHIFNETSVFGQSNGEWGLQPTPSSTNHHLTPLPELNPGQFPQSPNIEDDTVLSGCDILGSDQDCSFESISKLGAGTDAPIVPEHQYNKALTGRLLESYYLHFHSAHPILLPLRRRNKQLLRGYPRYLLATMQYVGSQYETKVFDEDYCNSISHMLASQTKKDGYLVQAMLIFTVTLHAQDQQQQARQMLGASIDLAIDLGMNRLTYAVSNGAGSQFLEESWRRTWWELYVLDGMLAALHQESSSKLNGIKSDVPLPCEEFDYSMGEVYLRLFSM